MQNEIRPYLTPYTKSTQNGLRLKSKTENYEATSRKQRSFMTLVWATTLLYKTPKAQATKVKAGKWDYNQTKNLLQSKGNNQQSGKTTYRMGRNSSRRWPRSLGPRTGVGRSGGGS